jgi:hypothetical protein
VKKQRKDNRKVWYRIGRYGLTCFQLGFLVSSGCLFGCVLKGGKKDTGFDFEDEAYSAHLDL